MPSKDDVARVRYGTTYDRLSAWGKRDIDRAFETPSYASTASEYNDQTPRIAKLVEELEAKSLECEDLWEENSELKAELAELQAKFNRPSSSSGHRE